jgi:manganese-dependent ADP-ribose/CDP-alcohol diphosphatase
LEAAKHAATHFQDDRVSLVLNLGDVIDGKCQDIVKHGGEQLPEGTDPGVFSIEEAIESLSPYTCGPIFHIYGNHELYNCHRTVLGEKLNIPFVKEPCGDLVGYRSHVHESVRFVVLDTYDIAIMQRCPESSQKRKRATQLLARHNPNYPELENSPEGMEGVQKRFVAFNGGVDTVQLEWLRGTLQQARDAKEKVIILSHQPILPGSSSPVCLVWNYDEVLTILREYNDVVVVSLSGHAHKGGYQRDEESGIHFRVIEAALESPSPIKTYGMVDMYDDRLIIRGFGECTSAEYDFDHTLCAAFAVNATL